MVQISCTVTRQRVVTSEYFWVALNSKFKRKTECISIGEGHKLPEGVRPGNTRGGLSCRRTHRQICRVGGNYIKNKELQTDAKRRNLWVCSISRASIVCIATRYRLDSPGIEYLWGRDFPQQPRPALGPCQTNIQWMSGLISGVNAAWAWRSAPTSI